MANPLKNEKGIESQRGVFFTNGICAEVAPQWFIG
jgi:hypothetical protein